MSFAWKGFHSFGGGFSPSFGPSLTGDITPIGSWDASTSTLAQLAALVSHSRTSLATMFDSTGKLTYAPNNLLLNTATLGTQTVTVQVGVNYILSIKGTGSVTLTGASTAGPLNGTGASNRVDLKITAATSSLTLTVAGSVTSARLSAVTYETAFRSQDDVDNTASAYYGPRIDYDPNTLAVKGLLIEEARTNLALNSNALSNASWTKATLTLSTDGTLGPDGAAISKITTTSGSTVGQIYSATPLAITSGSPFAQSWIVKKGNLNFVYLLAQNTTNTYAGAVFDISGTSDISASQTTVGITSGTIISATGKYIGNGLFRLTLVSSMAAVNAYPIIQYPSAATGNTFDGGGNVTTVAAANSTSYAGYVQHELEPFATSYIPTAAASVTRAADVVQFTGAALTALQGSAWSAVTEFNSPNPQPFMKVLKAAASASASDVDDVVLDLDASSKPRGYVVVSSSTQQAAAAGSAYTAGTNARLATAVKAGALGAAANGSTLYSGSGSIPSITVAALGNNLSTGAYLNGYIRSFAIYNQRLSDATLQSKSVVNAAY